MAAQTEQYTLVIDSRERYITRHMCEFANVRTDIRTITVGDYAIVSPQGKIAAVIERKTLEDYAASLKDGRADNIRKLRALRKETGCKIIYLIEGEYSPDPAKPFGGIPYLAIESSIFHLILRDSVCVLRSKGTVESAALLARLTRSASTLKTTGEAAPMAEDTPNTAHIDETGLLTLRRGKTDREYLREMWCCFRGIGTDSADEFISKYSLRDVLSGVIPRDEITALRRPNGKLYGKRLFQALTQIDFDVELRLLQKVPRVSRSTALSLLLSQTGGKRVPGGLARILSYPAEAIGIIKVGGKGGTMPTRSLGTALGEKIIALFTYCDKLVVAPATPTTHDNP